MNMQMNVAYKAVVSTLATACLLPALQAQTPLTTNQLLLRMDRDMAEVVLLYDAVKGTPIVNLTPQDARQQVSIQDTTKILARGEGKAEQPMAVGKVLDGLTVPGRGGNQIPIRIYVPAGNGPFPVVTYFHGGGFVIATIDTYDASARALCNYANAIVVSVEYRKAPEAPFPAARYDAIDAYQWVTKNITTYNGIASKVAVAGESAGGNLAIEVALAARGQFQAPTSQLLVYPLTSLNLTQLSDLTFTSSSLPLNTAGLKYFGALYAPGADPSNPDVAPINADLHGLPPTTIIAAELDPLVSDGQAYAAKLTQQGDKVTYQLYTGVTHEFFGLGAVVNKAKAAEMFGAAKLAASF
ncbi:MAG: alpha/beta hydrolase [Janthinobacterium lividum]